MRPTLFELVPFVGFYYYFKRYFKMDRRDLRQARIAIYVQAYHVFSGAIILLWLILK